MLFEAVAWVTSALNYYAKLLAPDWLEGWLSSWFLCPWYASCWRRLLIGSFPLILPWSCCTMQFFLFLPWSCWRRGRLMDSYLLLDYLMRIDAVNITAAVWVVRCHMWMFLIYHKLMH
ncbi:unnamed protein product [Amaranthus hypochondriacus]